MALLDLQAEPCLDQPARQQRSPRPPYHDREDDSGHSGLEDPEHSQAEDLHQGEEVDPAQGDMAKEGVVWLVLRRHQEELATFPELTGRTRAQRGCRAIFPTPTPIPPQACRGLGLGEGVTW